MNNIPATLPPAPWRTWPEILHLTQVLQAATEMRFVGGCVRDTLLGREVKDIDIATPLVPDAMADLLEQAGILVVPTGYKHGTLTAVIDERSFEITTLRRDVACDGRHADVEYTGDWQEDAARRDFTMNALYAAPDGTLYDYFGGREDLAARRVVFIGDAHDRIVEDYLRILRFFRFSAHYSDALDDKALAACARYAAELDTLSGERIRAEMLKLLTAPRVAEVLEAMLRTGVLTHVLPSLEDLRNMHALETIEQAHFCNSDAMIRLALLLRSMPGDKLELLDQIGARWKLSIAQTRELKYLLLPDAKVSPAMDEVAQKRAIRDSGAIEFAEFVWLRWAELLAERPKEKDRLRDAFLPMIGLACTWEPPTMPITGQDILDAGVPPGPEVGEALRILDAYWEEQGYAPGKEELIAYFKKRRG